MATWLMPMDEVLGLHSWEFKRGTTLADNLGWIRTTSKYYQRLKKRMREEGINLIPIHVMPGARSIHDGLHRAKIGYELGLPELLVSDERHPDGWDGAPIV